MSTTANTALYEALIGNQGITSLLGVVTVGTTTKPAIVAGSKMDAPPDTYPVVTFRERDLRPLPELFEDNVNDELYDLEIWTKDRGGSAVTLIREAIDRAIHQRTLAVKPKPGAAPGRVFWCERVPGGNPAQWDDNLQEYFGLFVYSVKAATG